MLDPDCKSQSGHYYPTNRTLISIFHDTERYLAVRRQAYKNLDFGPGVKVIRWTPSRGIFARFWKRSATAEASKHNKRNEKIRRDTESISRIMKDVGLSREDVVMVHSADWIIPALVNVITSVVEKDSPTFIIRVVDLPALSETDNEAHHRLADLQTSRSNVLIFCETEESAKAMKTKYGYSMVQPWIMPLAAQLGRGTQKPVDPAKTFVVGFLGGKRPDQQPQKIPEIARLLIASRKHWPVGKISFLMQSVASDTKRPQKFDAAINAINSIVADETDDRFTVEMLPPDLNEAEFGLAVERTHLLVLPRDVRTYRNRGSGLVIDGLLSGTPIAVSAGFAMRRWTEMAGAPSCKDSNEFAQAILQVAGNYDAFRETTLNARAQLLSFIDQRIEEVRSLGTKACRST